MSLIVPRPSGGCSITIGPFDRLIHGHVVDRVGIGGQEQRICSPSDSRR